jgi:outer membrane protein TolC
LRSITIATPADTASTRVRVSDPVERRPGRGKDFFVRPVLLLPILLTAVSAPAPAAAQGQPPPSSPARPPSIAPTPTPMPMAGAVFLGGVPAGAATPGVMPLTIIDAIRRALDHNLGVLTADTEVVRAQGARWRALSELLPNLNGRVSETREKINLAAFGFGGSGGPSFPGVSDIVGPFNVFDARVSVSQSVFDLGAINDTRSQSHSVAAARYTYQGARDFVIHVAGNLYIQALAASARAESARAQEATGRAIFNQAVDLKQGGLVAGIDVLRAEVELNTETQRVTASANDFEKIKLQLARVIGLPLGQGFSLDPTLPGLPEPDMTLEQAVDRAYATRPDYQAAVERIQAAEATRRAIVGDALPSIKVNADYGTIGLSPSDAQATFTVVGALNVPIFQGGRTRGRLLEADADIRRRRSEAEDLKASIYYEIRTAFLDLQATNQQLQVATKVRDLAAQQLTQSRDRFAAGIASNIDVVQAQEAVAVANEQYISSLYGYDLAKGALIRGIGTSEDMLRQLSGGAR